MQMDGQVGCKCLVKSGAIFQKFDTHKVTVPHHASSPGELRFFTPTNRG